MSNSQSLIDVSDLALMDQEPRIEDLKLAKRLGFAKSYNIRKLIERHKEDLSQFGDLCLHVETYRGQKYSRFYLNEEQALYIVAKSNTPIAALMTIQMVRVFNAWRLGRLQEPQQDTTPPTFYAKTMLADGTDSEVATRNQVKHLIGQVSKIMGVLEQMEAKVRMVDEKIRVFAVDSDSLAKCDMVMGHTLDVVMRHKSYKDRFIKDLKEENLRLRKAMEIMVHNQAMDLAA